MNKFLAPAIIAFISIYFQSWIGSFLVVVFFIGIERRKKNVVTGIEEKWNPTDELTKCIKGGAPWMFKVNASCFGLLTSYHESIDWKSIIRCSIEYRFFILIYDYKKCCREAKIFDYLVYSSQSNKLLYNCFVENLAIWFKLTVQSGDPALAKLFLDIFGSFSDVRTIQADAPRQSLTENGTLIILKKQAIRAINTNFRVENYSSAIRSCPLGDANGSTLALTIEDVELMLKEAAYFESRHRFKIDKMEVYFQTSEKTAVTALFSIINYLLQKDSETFQNLAEKYLEILELYLKLPLNVPHDIKCSDILDFLRYSEDSKIWKTDIGKSVFQLVQLWFGNRGNLQFRCKQGRV